MKNILNILIILTLFLSCKAQQVQTALPKVDNYTKGELELKITSFGENNPITIGKIMADGTIHFNWSKADISKTDDENYWTKSIERFYGGNFCRDSSAIVSNNNATLVENNYIYLFKYDQPVGVIMPSTQIGQEHNNNQLGSTIDWIYSDADTNVKANCNKKTAWKGRYSFNETTTYDLTFKKGFNLISNTLTAIEKWDNGEINGSLPKTRIIKSVDKIPSNMHWHLNYFANDELLEIEYQLFKLKPITKQQYESWLPKKMGSLKRTSYEFGKKIERMPTLNNVNLLFKKDAKTIDLTIVDCAGNKDLASTYTLIMEMASSDWKDKTETGYNIATEMDGTRVMIEYNEKEAKTTLYYNTDGRFLIKAEAINIKPEELWGIVRKLKMDFTNEATTVKLEGIITAVKNDCWNDGTCSIEIDNKWWLAITYGKRDPSRIPKKRGKKNIEFTEDNKSVGKKVKIYAKIEKGNKLTLEGSNAYYALIID